MMLGLPCADSLPNKHMDQHTGCEHPPPTLFGPFLNSGGCLAGQCDIPTCMRDCLLASKELYTEVVKISQTGSGLGLTLGALSTWSRKLGQRTASRQSSFPQRLATQSWAETNKQIGLRGLRC